MSGKEGCKQFVYCNECMIFPLGMGCPNRCNLCRGLMDDAPVTCHLCRSNNYNRYEYRDWSNPE